MDRSRGSKAAPVLSRPIVQRHVDIDIDIVAEKWAKKPPQVGHAMKLLRQPG